ncbi:MAG: histidine kinase, partial [Lachnospiraceae bacterium]|nr:histidine kinase [Lachnospiraceae bacterium]
FLYNTLNSIKWLGEMNGITSITEITASLSSMLHTIAKVESTFVDIATELSFIKDYLMIQSYRYGNSFDIEYNVSEPYLYNALIIKFILQPLVENAIFHGIEPSGRHGKIRIDVYTENKDLFMKVTDNGVGIDPQRLEKINSHTLSPSDPDKDIGISNINSRIVLEYGKEYGLKVESVVNEFTTVTIHTPLVLKDNQ